MVQDSATVVGVSGVVDVKSKGIAFAYKSDLTILCGGIVLSCWYLTHQKTIACRVVEGESKWNKCLPANHTLGLWSVI